MALVKINPASLGRDKYMLRYKYPNRTCKQCKKYPCFPEIDTCSSNFAAYGCELWEGKKYFYIE